MADLTRTTSDPVNECSIASIAIINLIRYLEGIMGFIAVKLDMKYVDL